MNIPSELNFARRKRLPIIQGAEAAECGLACIAMVARYHGHDVDLNGLRQRFTLSMSGATLRSIMGFADSLGFAPRELKVELSALDKVRLPAILHWDLNHFVVLKSVSRGKAVIHDPALGARTYSLGDLSNHFTGVALELTQLYWGDSALTEYSVPSFTYFGLLALLGLTMLWLGIMLLKVENAYPALRVLAWLNMAGGVLAASIILLVVAVLPMLAAMVATALVFFNQMALLVKRLAS